MDVAGQIETRRSPA